LPGGVGLTLRGPLGTPHWVSWGLDGDGWGAGDGWFHGLERPGLLVVVIPAGICGTLMGWADLAPHEVGASASILTCDQVMARDV
jgi:hypothetical protein